MGPGDQETVRPSDRQTVRPSDRGSMTPGPPDPGTGRPTDRGPQLRYPWTDESVGDGHRTQWKRNETEEPGTASVRTRRLRNHRIREPGYPWPGEPRNPWTREAATPRSRGPDGLKVPRRRTRKGWSVHENEAPGPGEPRTGEPRCRSTKDTEDTGNDRSLEHTETEEPGTRRLGGSSHRCSRAQEFTNPPCVHSADRPAVGSVSRETAPAAALQKSGRLDGSPTRRG